jgi:putative holliday junction resolvase
VPNSPETLLAFDFGTRRTGVALGNTLTRAARPLTTLHAEANAERLKLALQLIDQWQPTRLVVGQPLQEDGTPTHATAAAAKFARALHAQAKLPVESVDERLSSAEAATQGAENVDAEAAAIILRRYLSALPEH